MNPRTDSGIPKPKWGSRHPQTKLGSPNRNGDAHNPQIDLGIPKLKWGSRYHHSKRGSPNQNGDANHKESPNRFGDPRTEMGINTSPYQNRDPRIGLGIVQSLTRSSVGLVPIWGPRGFVPKFEWHSKWGPHIGTGIPESVWVGICQYSKSGSPRSSMGFIPIWGPTYTRTWIFEPSVYFSGCKIE
jgi:hypothetical protein